MARVLNKDAVAAKQHAEEKRGDTESIEAPKRRVAIINDRTIINGHVLPVGCVVELSHEDIVNHRRHGVPLDDVDDERDRREVFDVTQPVDTAKEDDNGDKD